MANTLTAVIPVILAQGMMALRQNAIMARLVNTLPSGEVKQKGETISIPIPSAIEVQQVSPSNYPPSTADIIPTNAEVKLDQWWEAPFYLTDADIVNAVSGIIPMQASESIKSLANKVDSTLLALYKKVYGFAGSDEKVTPFATSTKEATDARKVLNNQLCPLEDRRFVMDADAEANALNLRAFQDYNFTGSFEDVKSGKLSPKLGFTWFMNQNIPSHTRGACDAAYQINGAHSAGVSSLTVKTGSGLGKAGDIFTIAGHSQTYVLTADMTAITSMAISPKLQVVLSGDEMITFKGTIDETYAQNLAFHRDAFAFGSRILDDPNIVKGGHEMSSIADPVSGLTLRLEVSREHKRTRWSFDILFGCAVARPELACRVWGA